VIHEGKSSVFEPFFPKKRKNARIVEAMGDHISG
jgi:hypothetical protein